jgi:hypothetical protein
MQTGHTGTWSAFSYQRLGMRNKLKFYLNLALFGFTVGQTYSAFQRRVARARGQMGRRPRWN